MCVFGAICDKNVKFLQRLSDIYPAFAVLWILELQFFDAVTQLAQGQSQRAGGC
jgi:hypothetical protein